jgi:hypothetical protein
MKKSKLLLMNAVLMIEVLSLSAKAETTRTSIAGHVFTQVDNHPELGDAWKDEYGLIWGDLAPQGMMSSEGAENYCLSIGAKLPTQEQFIGLDKLIGNSESTMTINGAFIYGKAKTEVIPNLVEHVYLTATPHPIDNDPTHNLIYVFDYGSDAALKPNDPSYDVINDYLGAADSVRCVL